MRVDGSPRIVARVTGALYLYIMVAAMFAEVFVRDKLLVPGNGDASAHHIVANETLYRWGVAADVSTTVCDIAVAALLYVLLRPVNRTVALLAAFFRLAYSAAMALDAAFTIAPLLLLSDPASLSKPGAAQTESLVMYSLRLHGAGFDVALVLFGIHLVLIGLLIARSRLLPRSIGVALCVAGTCYTVNSFVTFLSPGLASQLFPWLLLPGFLAEAALTLRLLIAGVDVRRLAHT
jgi:hypothetical protein